MSKLISEQTLKWVGKEFPPVKATVDERELKKFYASTSAKIDFKNMDLKKGSVVPRYMYMLAEFDVYSEDDLEPDGRVVEQYPPTKAERVVAGGTDIEFFQDIKLGDTIISNRKITDIFEKEGKNGPLCFVIYETTFRNQVDELLALVKRTTILY